MRDEIVATMGVGDVPEIEYPSLRDPNIAFACVVWQDAERLERLLTHVRPYFTALAVGVQKSTDGTLDVARRLADIVVTDEHRGFGDATFGPKILPQVTQSWTFKVDADEFPSEDLLGSLPHAARAAEKVGVEGVWIPFRSSIEGFYWEEQHSHLRLFRTHLGWPNKLHSRPPVWRCLQWMTGFIDHSRSLDEMMQDYLSYYRIGLGDTGWTKHNQLMMRNACIGTAKKKGWHYVKQFPWWPEVRKAAFIGGDPMVVFCAGPSGSGTRMLFDKVSELGVRTVHASLPGYFDNPEPGGTKFDLEHPHWWTQEELENGSGDADVRWVIITRDPNYSGRSSLGRGFVASLDDYGPYLGRATETLDSIEGAYRLRYEDFVADPQGEYDKLADWLGVTRRQVSPVFDGNQKYEDEILATVEEPEVEELEVVEPPKPTRAPTRRSTKRRSTGGSRGRTA